MRSVGLLLVAVGLVIAGVAGWQIHSSNAAAWRAYDTERAQFLRETSSRPSERPTAAPRGIVGRSEAPTGLLSIPAIGLKDVPVLPGTSAAVLARGVGHYTGTAEAGQVGNYALAGHRITHGQPFARLLQLNRGDRVIVRTRDAVYTYVLDTSPRDLTVDQADRSVLRPHPGERELTLTTCTDLFHSGRRSVAFGHLGLTQRK